MQKYIIKCGAMMRTSTYQKLQKCVLGNYSVRHRDHQEAGDDVDRKHRPAPFLYVEKEKAGNENHVKIQNDQLQRVGKIPETSRVEL